MLAVERQAVAETLAVRMEGSGAVAQEAKPEVMAAPQEQARLVETWVGAQVVPRVATGAAATVAGVQVEAVAVEEASVAASVTARPVVVCRAAA